MQSSKKIARRDKKAFLSDKTIEWERPEISSRKLDTEGTFNAKMGTIKNRNQEHSQEKEMQIGKMVV